MIMTLILNAIFFEMGFVTTCSCQMQNKSYDISYGLPRVF